MPFLNWHGKMDAVQLVWGWCHMAEKKRRFGEIAVRAGFISEDDVHKALARQKEIASNGGNHKLMGIIMLELGLLSNAQLIHVLKEIEAQ